MNIETFSDWLRRQNHRVIRSESSCWFDAGPRVYQAFPYGEIIQPSKKELRDLLVNNNILAVRYSTPLDSPEGIISYHVVLYPPYDLQSLDHRARNNIKRGLCSCQVHTLPFEQLAADGWKLQGDTIERQNRTGCMSQKEWESICLSAVGLPGFNAWGAFVDGNLTASIITARIGDTWYVPYAQCLKEFLCQRVNNALFFTASTSMLSEEGVRGIFFSLHSLDAPESVNEFKFRMGHAAKPVRQRVVLHPVLAPFVNRSTYRVIHLLSQRDPCNSFLSKAEGMLRFYMQGKQPASQQPWPDCLAQQKAIFYATTGSLFQE